MVRALLKPIYKANRASMTMAKMSISVRAVRLPAVGFCCSFISTTPSGYRVICYGLEAFERAGVSAQASGIGKPARSVSSGKQVQSGEGADAGRKQSFDKLSAVHFHNP